MNLFRAVDFSKSPGPPGVPKILNFTSSSVTLSWTTPELYLGDSQITGYTVEFYSSDLHTGWVVAARQITSDSTTVFYFD